jgi:hypothetical protein
MMENKEILWGEATDLEGNPIDLWGLLLCGIVIPYTDGSKKEIYLKVSVDNKEIVIEDIK